MNPYTHDGDAVAEERVRADFDRTVEAVRELGDAEGLRAVLLLGGYARGEGVVIEDASGVVRGFNDYDFLLVFDSLPRDTAPYRELSKRLALEFGIDFVDFGYVTPEIMATAPPTLFWYELGEVVRTLWERPGSGVVVPRFPVDALDPAEGSRLLFNRGMGLLWAGYRLWPGLPGDGDGAGDDDAIRFSVIAAHKSILAVGDALLLGRGTYHPSQAERTRRVAGTGTGDPVADPALVAAYARGAAFRRCPEFPSAADAGALWLEARAFHEAGFREMEARRVGPFAGWDDYPARLRGYARSRSLASPRALARTVVRTLRGDGELTVEERRFLDLADLLYCPARNARTGPAWQREARIAVEDWHP